MQRVIAEHAPISGRTSLLGIVADPVEQARSPSLVTSTASRCLRRRST